MRGRVFMGKAACESTRDMETTKRQSTTFRIVRTSEVWISMWFISVSAERPKLSEAWIATATPGSCVARTRRWVFRKIPVEKEPAARRDASPSTMSHTFTPQHLLLRASVCLLVCASARADYKADIGWSKLQAELGGALPSGAGVAVSQVEAPESAGNYGPNTTSAEFTGKTFTFKSGAAGNSGHATKVAEYYYGLAGSIAPGVTTIDVYEVNQWLGSGFLRRTSTGAPLAEVRAIQSHSWIGSFGGDGSADIEVLRRFDFAIQQSEFLGVVGLNNFSQGTLPALLAGSFNGMSVGRSDGLHSYGTNTADGAGRTKPELVAPIDATSWATPTVAATAALLRQNAPLNARKPVALKALLLAGATKNQFPGWNRTTTRPIDSIYGAGQVNMYRSHHILAAGQQAASTSVSVGVRGWDLNTTTAATRLYFFNVAAGNTAPGLSAVLTWNRVIEDGLIGPLWGSPTSTLANLTLKLYSATGFTLGAQVDSSESAVDNIEHIYQPALAPGRYALEVSGDTSAVTYGLAWYSQPTVTATATAAAAEHGLVAGMFTFTRSGDTTAALTVSYAMSGTATAGSDYQTLTGTATFAAASATATVALTPLADALAEGSETATLTLTQDIHYSIGSANAATASIADLPMDAWRFAAFTTAELADNALSGDMADFDKDGIRNLLEYALALDPKTPATAGLPFATGTLSLTYTRVKAAVDLTYIVEVTNDFATWNSGPAFTTVPSTIDNGATETITAASLLAPGAGQFMRLRVQR